MSEPDSKKINKVYWSSFIWETAILLIGGSKSSICLQLKAKEGKFNRTGSIGFVINYPQQKIAAEKN